MSVDGMVQNMYVLPVIIDFFLLLFLQEETDHV